MIITSLKATYKNLKIKQFCIKFVPNGHRNHMQNLIIMLSKKFKNQHVLNGRTDFLVMIIELLRFLNCTCHKNHLAKF